MPVVRALIESARGFERCSGLHGRYVCQARKPRCWECAVASCCDFTPKTPAPAPGQV